MSLPTSDERRARRREEKRGEGREEGKGYGSEVVIRRRDVMRGGVIVMRGGVMEDLTGNLTRDTYLYH